MTGPVEATRKLPGFKNPRAECADMQAKTRAADAVIRCRDLDEAVRHFEAITTSGGKATLARSRDGWIVERLASADE